MSIMLGLVEHWEFWVFLFHSKTSIVERENHPANPSQQWWEKDQKQSPRNHGGFCYAQVGTGGKTFRSCWLVVYKPFMEPLSLPVAKCQHILSIWRVRQEWNNPLHWLWLWCGREVLLKNTHVLKKTCARASSTYVGFRLDPVHCCFY